MKSNTTNINNEEIALILKSFKNTTQLINNSFCKNIIY
jgi:hypothetical protein